MSTTSRLIRNPIFIWTLANFTGLGAMGLLTVVISTPVLMTRLGTTLIISIPIGLAQWIALRRFADINPLWIFTITIGVFLVPYLSQVIPEGLWEFLDDESVLVLTSFPFFIGFIIGLAQWLILRRRVPGAIVWLPGSAVGLAGGFWFILVTNLIDIPILNIVIAGLVYSITTGFILNRLLTNYRTPPAKVFAAP